MLKVDVGKWEPLRRYKEESKVEYSKEELIQQFKNEINNLKLEKEIKIYKNHLKEIIHNDDLYHILQEQPSYIPRVDYVQKLYNVIEKFPKKERKQKHRFLRRFKRKKKLPEYNILKVLRPEEKVKEDQKNLCDILFDNKSLPKEVFLPNEKDMKKFKNQKEKLYNILNKRYVINKEEYRNNIKQLKDIFYEYKVSLRKEKEMPDLYEQLHEKSIKERMFRNADKKINYLIKNPDKINIDRIIKLYKREEVKRRIGRDFQAKDG